MKKVTACDVITAQEKMKKGLCKFAKVLPFVSMGLMMLSVVSPAFAASDDYTDKVKSLIQTIINIISFLAVGIGVFMAIWGIIGMIMAAKQEDTNAQTQASQKLMTGIALIAAPIIIQALDLDGLIMDRFNEIKPGSTGNGSGGN